jgi:hypothetical protein
MHTPLCGAGGGPLQCCCCCCCAAHLPREDGTQHPPPPAGFCTPPRTHTVHTHISPGTCRSTHPHCCAACWCCATPGLHQPGAAAGGEGPTAASRGCRAASHPQQWAPGQGAIHQPLLLLLLHTARPWQQWVALPPPHPMLPSARWPDSALPPPQLTPPAHTCCMPPASWPTAVPAVRLAVPAAAPCCC